jgi:hypothetical protein
VSSSGDHLSTVISGLVPSLLGSQSIYSSKLNANEKRHIYLVLGISEPLTYSPKQSNIISASEVLSN